MRHDCEIEYIPLDRLGEEPIKERGFLHWLFCRLVQALGCCSEVTSASSSGGEVEENIIEF